MAGGGVLVVIPRAGDLCEKGSVHSENGEVSVEDGPIAGLDGNVRVLRLEE